MKFIVDAPLPMFLAKLLRENGHDAVHTKELPNGNDTDDEEINRISLAESRIVVSKDGDFYNSFTAKKEPYKLLHITTGNITNKELTTLIENNLGLIVDKLSFGSVIEVSRDYVITIQ